MRRRAFGGLISGVLIGLPFAANAQQRVRSHRIAFLALTPGEDQKWLPLMLDRLSELGYVQGRNLELAYRSAEGHSDRMPALAAELVAMRPDVLVTGFGTIAAKVAKGATATIPIVFTTVGDPVGAGIVASLARPGGNVTGLTDQAKDTGGKRLELLQEASGGKTSFALLMNPETPYSALATQEIRTIAQSRQIRIKVLEARSFDEVSRQLGQLADSDVAGVIVLNDPLTISLRGEIAELLARRRLPAIFQFRETAEAGALMSYGPDRRQIYRRAAEYVDKVLRGAKPADLPVEQPTTFELVINLKAARAILLDLPPSLIARADEVIE